MLSSIKHLQVDCEKDKKINKYQCQCQYTVCIYLIRDMFLSNSVESEDNLEVEEEEVGLVILTLYPCLSHHPNQPRLFTYTIRFNKNVHSYNSF